MLRKPHEFRDLSRLTRTVRILLGLGVAMAVIGLASSWLQLELLGRESFTAAEGAVNDQRERIVDILSIGLFIITAIFFGRWIYRAHQNVRALGERDLRFTPGWAVGYFFVPIFGLWRPYQAMKELWHASQPPAERYRSGTATTLGLWWALWLGCGFVEQAAARTSINAHTIGSLQTATALMILYDLLYVPLCIVAGRLIARIHAAQLAHWRARVADE